MPASSHDCGGIAAWLDAMAAALRAGAAADLRCPCCGHGALRLVVVADDLAAVRATAYFWCDRCLWGVMPSRCEVRAGTAVATRGDVPDYRIVTP